MHSTYYDDVIKVDMYRAMTLLCVALKLFDAVLVNTDDLWFKFRKNSTRYHTHICSCIRAVLCLCLMSQ